MRRSETSVVPVCPSLPPPQMWYVKLCGSSHVVTTRQAIYAVIDNLDDSRLELALQVLQDIQGGPFDLSEDEENELRAREHECERGERVDARSFLSELQREGESSHSDG